MESIIEKANECLCCKLPMCRKGCPVATNIPEFISNIKNGNIEKAYNILQENNILSSICSRVCPSEDQCMGSCIRGIKQNSVQINTLERYVNDVAEEKNIKYNIEIKENIDKKVAIIGSGPAGISCAYELLKKGYKTTIFEKEEKCGGILRYGIPDFRLDKSYIDAVIERLRKSSVKIRNNCEFEKDFSIKDLKEQGYDAIFLGIGATDAIKYSLGIDNKNILTSNDILYNYSIGKKLNLGKTVVIGGGNVAIDTARTAKRMTNEDVYILYRRDRTCMPARDIEVEEALADDIKIIFNTKVLEAKESNGILKLINCIKTKIEEGKVLDIPNSEFEMKVDNVVFAIGLKPTINLQLEKENDIVKIDEYGKTSIEGVFAGGDLTETKSTVCKAIFAGKQAAEGIDKFLRR